MEVTCAGGHSISAEEADKGWMDVAGAKELEDGNADTGGTRAGCGARDTDTGGPHSRGRDNDNRSYNTQGTGAAQTKREVETREGEGAGTANGSDIPQLCSHCKVDEVEVEGTRS